MFTFCLTILAVTNFGQQMSLEEQEQTGVSTLSPIQRNALENWIEKHCRLYCTEQKESATQTLSLFTNLEGGRRLELSDGHIYEVSPEDLLISASWITPFFMKLEPSGDPNYPLQIVNTQTGRIVRVKKIS